MNRRYAFCQLVLARIREFYREPEAVFWVYGFPLILALGLGIAFKSSDTPPPSLDIEADAGDTQAKELADYLKKNKLDVGIHDSETAAARLFKGKTALVIKVDPTTKNLVFVYDRSRADGALAREWVQELLLRKQLGEQAPTFEDKSVQEPGSRYIDFLLPGLIGMNIMGGGLFGLGFVLVDMRVRKLFKRLLATPMRRGDFLMSLLSARLLFLMPEMCALILIGTLVFGVPLKGSPFTLALIILTGALAFAGIGLLAGCRTDKTETISGIINVVMLPMYLLSGIFFTAERFPESAQPFIQSLPLTQLNNAMREVMLEGAGLDTVGWRILALAAWAGGTFFIALRWFRWS